MRAERWKSAPSYGWRLISPRFTVNTTSWPKKSRFPSMHTSALQAFLRNLGGPLAAVGVPPRSVADLRSVADALEPFRDIDLEQLSSFLHRADAYRRAGAVPVTADAPGL